MSFLLPVSTARPKVATRPDFGSVLVETAEGGIFQAALEARFVYVNQAFADMLVYKVDELLGQQQVVIKNLGDGLGRVQGVSGGSIMGDGRIRLILDIPGLMTLAQN